MIRLWTHHTVMPSKPHFNSLSMKMSGGTLSKDLQKLKQHFPCLLKQLPCQSRPDLSHLTYFWQSQPTLKNHSIVFKMLINALIYYLRTIFSAIDFRPLVNNYWDCLFLFVEETDHVFFLSLFVCFSFLEFSGTCLILQDSSKIINRGLTISIFFFTLFCI